MLFYHLVLSSPTNQYGKGGMGVVPGQLIGHKEQRFVWVDHGKQIELPELGLIVSRDDNPHDKPVPEDHILVLVVRREVSTGDSGMEYESWHRDVCLHIDLKALLR